MEQPVVLASLCACGAVGSHHLSQMNQGSTAPVSAAGPGTPLCSQQGAGLCNPVLASWGLIRVTPWPDERAEENVSCRRRGASWPLCSGTWPSCAALG